jgi:hypothetical protein
MMISWPHHDPSQRRHGAGVGIRSGHSLVFDERDEVCPLLELSAETPQETFEVFWQTFTSRHNLESSASRLTGRIETTKTANSRLGHGIDAHRGQRRSVSYKQGSKRNVNPVAMSRTIRVYREADTSIGKIDPLEIRSRRNRRYASENDCQLDSAERDRGQRTIAAAQFGRVRNQVRRSRRVARQ